MNDEWTPKTRLGQMIHDGEVTTMHEALATGLPRGALAGAGPHGDVELVGAGTFGHGLFLPSGVAYRTAKAEASSITVA